MNRSPPITPPSHATRPHPSGPPDPFVRVRGARENNLRDVQLDVPRDAFVVFTGVSGSGKSSLAFGTLYAEAQRRYFESVAPYARRLIQQVGAPQVDSITGLPPAIALQQQRGAASSRSTVGTLTTLSNSLRLLFSRAGRYPPGTRAQLPAEAFSPNTPAGACPQCHGLGSAYDVTEASLVHDEERSIRQGAVSAWPGAWQSKNLRDILIALGVDVDKPWRKLPKATRAWILFTDEQPVVAVKPGLDRNEYDYNGKFVSAKRHVLQTLAHSKSERMRERALQFVVSVRCPACRGRRLRPEALAVTFAGHNIAELNELPLLQLAAILRAAAATGRARVATAGSGAEASLAAVTIVHDLLSRIDVLHELGLGYLSLGRASTTLSPGETQRLRIATQLRSGLFGVVYVLDEPSAGLHPVDTEPLLRVLTRLKVAGNSLFIVEHNLDLMRRADWLVDIGPGAGEYGGRVLYSGPVAGLREVEASMTRHYLFPGPLPHVQAASRPKRAAREVLRLQGIRANNLADLNVEIPLGVMTAVIGVSGSGKSTLVSHVLGGLVGRALGMRGSNDARQPGHAPTPAL